MRVMRHIDAHVAGRALDALAPSETVQVDRHIALCPACQQVLHEAQETAHLLTLVVNPVQPPWHCKARVMARIVQDIFQQRSAR